MDHVLVRRPRPRLRTETQILVLELGPDGEGLQALGVVRLEEELVAAHAVEVITARFNLAGESATLPGRG
jgi:hypothetical protein